MKKVIYLFAVVALTVGFVSCSNDDEPDFDNAEPNLELRAASLGFSDVDTYKTCVAEQCILGNHKNCDILTDGTHQACAYQEHCGTKHDGSHHNGSDHGIHDADGHSHGSHGNGNGNHH